MPGSSLASPPVSPSSASSASTAPLPPTPAAPEQSGSSSWWWTTSRPAVALPVPEQGDGGHSDSDLPSPSHSENGKDPAAQPLELQGSAYATPPVDFEGRRIRGRKSAKPDRTTSKVKEQEIDGGNARPAALRTKRTWKHESVRIAALFLVPAALAAPVSLILTLTRLLLQPIYNSTPLSLRTPTVYAAWTISAALAISYVTRRQSLRSAIGGRVCLCISALGGDLIAIGGRRMGSLAGQFAGAEWGAIISRTVLGFTVVGGGIMFAVLCYDFVLPLQVQSPHRSQFLLILNLLLRGAFYVVHVWFGERIWLSLLGDSTNILAQNPERSILCTSMLLTVTALLLRSEDSSPSFARSMKNFAVARLKLSKSGSNDFWSIFSRLPKESFPLLLLLRIPLLIIALRQQGFLRPAPPYLAADNTLRVISSQRGLTGQILVGEEVTRGFRFLRCDASILGGRWVRTVQTSSGGSRTDLGDSIFATFPLQEIGLLAHRAGETESIARTVSLTTGLQVAPEQKDTTIVDDRRDRALIIGLGVGIAAQAFSHQGIDIDLVEIDPLVYEAAVDHFDLSLPPATSTVNLLDGNEYVSSLARMRREGSYDGQKWRYVIQDCFSGGSVPDEMFTREFWLDLTENLELDGIVAMNFVGVLRSKASRAVLVTLTSVFEQCRAFGDPAESHVDESQSINMVVFCTNALSPLLTFRRPTPADVRRSPLRSHVYSASQGNEILLHDVITAEDRLNPDFMLRRGENKMSREGWQVASGLSMWYNMQKILTPEMWMTF